MRHAVDDAFPPIASTCVLREQLGGDCCQQVESVSGSTIGARITIHVALEALQAIQVSGK